MCICNIIISYFIKLTIKETKHLARRVHYDRAYYHQIRSMFEGKKKERKKKENEIRRARGKAHVIGINLVVVEKEISREYIVDMEERETGFFISRPVHDD